MENKRRILIVVLSTLFNGCVGSDSFNCTFDEDVCNWRTIINRNYKLTWGRQNRTTTNTGPDSDHTSGVGSFIYINSSYELADESARLSTSWRNSPGKYCLAFWYYMYGRDTDVLRVAVKEDKIHPNEIVRMSKDQRKMWSFKTKEFKTKKKFKIYIEGFIYNDAQDFGYIAVDDIMMFPEKCPTYCSDPTPSFGKPVAGDIWEGSIVQITCKEGYEVKGNQSIVCQGSGKWNDTPTCQPVDCGKPPLGRNMSDATFGNTTFNTTITVSCSRGFTLIGNSSITCMANRTWSTLPRCVINNCSDPTPRSGNVSSTDFIVGSVVQITCATGYKLTGDPQIVCQTNSAWSDNPDCERIECSKPILTKGLLEPNGTTWYTNQFITFDCADGSTLRGSAKITCQDSGNWTILPTCDYTEESSPNSLTAVVVTVPLLAIGIIVITTVVVCSYRKRKRSCMKGDKTHEAAMNRQTQYPNKTYNNYGLNADSLVADKSLEQETEYASISNEKSRPEMKDVVYYNTVKYGTDAMNDVDYDHMKTSFESSLDNAYSHIQDNNNDFKSKQSKNSTDSYSYTNAAFQENDDEYNHINLDRPNDSGHQNIAINSYQEQETDYDHAKAGGCDPINIDLDEYSHLNRTVKDPGERVAKMSTLTFDTLEERDKEMESEYREPTVDTPEYFNVEKVEDQYTPVEDRPYFVLEKEDKDEEYFNTDIQHDYFILEKNY